MGGFISGFGLGRPFEKNRITALNQRAVESPRQTTSQVRRWLIGIMARKRTRHTLKSRSGHVEEQFSQMRTPLGVAQIFFDGFAPAAAQSAANHFSHGRFGLTAFFVWRVIHGHRDVTDHQRGVHREANLHVVNRLQRLPCAFAGNIKQFRFGIAHVGFNFP